ncbi:hypothetical protein ACCO45_000156 [Purpureocillium lilacinum]|uniref:Uncharacterized protein n=1 Tax=Purpureocillium lilacinum TaxID=33203 RepID=A0ACC4E4R6_PURLI
MQLPEPTGRCSERRRSYLLHLANTTTSQHHGTRDRQLCMLQTPSSDSTDHQQLFWAVIPQLHVPPQLSHPSPVARRPPTPSFVRPASAGSLASSPKKSAAAVRLFLSLSRLLRGLRRFGDRTPICGQRLWCCTIRKQRPASALIGRVSRHDGAQVREGACLRDHFCLTRHAACHAKGNAQVRVQVPEDDEARRDGV